MPLQEVQAAYNCLSKGFNIPKSELSPFPTVGELLEPPKINWEDLIVPDIEMNVTRKFEQAVARQVREGRMTMHEAALSYIDYCITCHHPAELAVCYLTASIWFLRELEQKASQTPKQCSQLYALKNAVRWCLECANTITRLVLHPGMHLYVSRLGLVAMLHAVKLGNIATPEDSAMVAHFLEIFQYNCRLCPFWHAPIVMVSEAVLLHILTGRLHSEFVLGLQDVSVDILPISKSELQYQLYENDLRHVNSLDDSAEGHRNAMWELLAEKGWNFDDVVELMTSPLSPRSPDGWLLRQPKLGNSPEFTQLAGFTINIDAEKSSIQLLLVPSSRWRGRIGLFSRADIDSILCLCQDDLFPMFFSLDPPNEHQRFHPFQQFRFSPENLCGTDLLHTLFETDYLLKSFSVGSEVSSIPPFNQRPCNEGLTADLPPSLHEILKPVSERGHTFNRINRFWIQAEKLVYSHSQYDSGVQEFIFSDPIMAVRSHPQLPGKDGIEDTENEHDPDSPEAKFAADLTAHYNEISEHFPMFARLQELVKLQFFGVVLNSVLTDLQEQAEGKDFVVSDQLLQEVQTKQRNLQIADRNKMLGNVYQKIRPNLNWSTYDYIQSQLVDVLMQSQGSKLSRATLKRYVSDWINPSKGTNARLQAQFQLATYLCSGLPLHTRHEVREILLNVRQKRYQSFRKEVESLKSAAQTFAPPKSPNPCMWVPAALNSADNGSSLCYGGVILAPRIIQGKVERERNAKQVTLRPTQRSALSKTIKLVASKFASSSQKPGYSQGFQPKVRQTRQRTKYHYAVVGQSNVTVKVKERVKDTLSHVFIVVVHNGSMTKEYGTQVQRDSHGQSAASRNQTEIGKLRQQGANSEGGGGGRSGGCSGGSGGGGGGSGGGGGGSGGGGGGSGDDNFSEEHGERWQRIKDEARANRWKEAKLKDGSKMYEAMIDGELRFVIIDHAEHGGSGFKVWEEKRSKFVFYGSYDENLKRLAKHDSPKVDIPKKEISIRILSPKKDLK